MSKGDWLWTCCILHTFLLLRVYTTDMVPSIVFPKVPKTEIILQPDIYVLECKANGHPKPTYKWTFNGNKLTESMSVDSKRGNLTIRNFSLREEGLYQCSAQNTIRGINVTALSPVVTLMKARIGLSWETDIVYVTAHVGGYVKLTCDNPPASVPSGRYKWYTTSGATSETIEEIERIHADAEGSLHILKVEKDDARGYKCSLFNPPMETIKLGSEKNVTVYDKKIEDQNVTLRYKTRSSTKFLLTKYALLECIFSGELTSKISWFDPSGNLIVDNDKYSIDAVTLGRRLVVYNLQEDDEGNYTCTSAHGQEEHVWLDVTSPPIWVQSLTTAIVPENKDAIFTCKARPAVGDNPLNPTKWMLNGDPLDIKDHSRFKMSKDRATLTVTKLNKTTDVMCFQCNVSNQIGFKFGDGCLQVIAPIVKISFPDLQQTISKGEIINLTVTGSGDPDYPPLYRHRLNNEILDLRTNPYITFNEATMETYINTSTLSDEDYKKIGGIYQIELYNKYDSVIVSTEVVLEHKIVVEKEVTVVPVATAGIPGRGLWWISIIIAGLICVIIVIIIIVICKRFLRKKRLYNARKVADDKAKMMDPFHPVDNYESRLSLEPESLDTDADNSERGGWLQDLDSDEDIDLREFNEDGSFIGNYELSRVSLNHI